MMELDFNKLGGLVPAVVQDAETNEVLMVGFMNREAWETTLETRRATFFSRTRNALWTKGLTSGNVQIVKEIFVDCDDDTVLAQAAGDAFVNEGGVGGHGVGETEGLRVG